MEKTGVTEGNHKPWMGDHYSVTCQHQELNSGCSSDKRETYGCTIQAIKILGVRSKTGKPQYFHPKVRTAVHFCRTGIFGRFRILLENL